MLEIFFNFVQRDLKYFVPRAPRTQNLSQGEKEAIKSVANNESIIIKSSDKSNTIVVMDIENYIQEPIRQLSDDKFYVKLTSDITVTHVNKVRDILQEMYDNYEIELKPFQSLAAQSSVAMAAPLKIFLLFWMNTSNHLSK